MKEDYLLLNLKCKDLDNCIGIVNRKIKKREELEADFF